MKVVNGTWKYLRHRNNVLEKECIYKCVYFYSENI